MVLDTDEFINRASSAKGFAGLRPVPDKEGGVAALNASGINDGYGPCTGLHHGTAARGHPIGASGCRSLLRSSAGR